LRSVGFSDARAISWGQTTRRGNLLVTAHRVYHHAGSLFGGGLGQTAAAFTLQSGGLSVFFAGDTGYGPEFARIGAAMPGYALAMVPIGAYEPRAQVKRVHANPEEAVQIARDVGAHVAVGMHWGTYAFSLDGTGEPQRRFLAAADVKIQARVLAIGQTWVWDGAGSGHSRHPLLTRPASPPHRRLASAR
jgi:N-acyl-phosphatidylethanolamine-hydrolysing phospholipase D